MKVKKVNYDSTYTGGCETCDWGSSYINDIEIIFENDEYVHIKLDKMYEYMLSESDFINILGISNDIDDMWSNLFTRISEKCWHGDVSMYIELTGFCMTVNGKNVDIVKSCKRKCLNFY